MEKLTVEELHSLRLKIFDNAENLQKEAKLLLEHGMISRAYLLAHFCFEELGKIPIIVGAIAKNISTETVDWKKLRKRFYSHTEKIVSQNHHYYVFGLEADLLKDSDVKWLEKSQSTVDWSFKKKNLATYVDAQNGNFLLPSEQITQNECEELVKLAFECLRAHWHSETLTNPILIEAANKAEKPKLDPCE